jgi:protease I
MTQPKRKILILSGDCAEGLEVMYPLQRLQEAGFNAVVASPKGKVIRSVCHDFEPDFETYTEKPAYRINANISYDKVKPEEYDGLVIPGGRAPEYIRNEAHAVEIVNHFFKAKKPIAAICHAAQLLVACDQCKGRTMSAYPALKPDVERAGGTFKASDNFEEPEAIVDGNLVTARAWPDHPAFMREFLRLLH